MFDAACTNGLCYFQPVKKDADWDTFWGDDLLGLAKMEKPSVKYGEYTAASKLSDVVEQPRYIIEAIKRWPEFAEAAGLPPAEMARVREDFPKLT